MYPTFPKQAIVHSSSKNQLESAVCQCLTACVCWSHDHAVVLCTASNALAASAARLAVIDSAHPDNTEHFRLPDAEMPHVLPVCAMLPRRGHPHFATRLQEAWEPWFPPVDEVTSVSLFSVAYTSI